MRLRASHLALACIALAACAPTIKSSRVLSATEVHVGTDLHPRQSAPLYRGSHVDSVSGDVVVEVETTLDCTEWSRTGRRIEDRTDRGLSWGLIGPGVGLALLGGVMLADPESWCAREKSGPCYVEVSEVVGALQLATGLALTVAGISTAGSDHSVRHELDEPSARHVPACRSLPGDGVPVMLILSDGTKLVAIAGDSGQARFAVGVERWARDGGELRARISVESQPALDITLQRR
jgi:hypothetical protein